MKRRNWTDEENRIVVGVYMRLLNAELAGKPMNKAKMCRETLPRLNGRTRGSYEMKLMNISAAMAENGFPIVTGYKPYGNCQSSLKALIRNMAKDVAA